MKPVLGRKCVFRQTHTGGAPPRGTLWTRLPGGAVGEVLEFDNCKGGSNDLIFLQDVFKKSEEFIGAKKQQDITRWAALMAYFIIKENEEAFEKLIGALGEGKSVEECCAIIESSETSS